MDTLTIARELRAADLPGAQAEAIAAAIRRAVSEGAATKADLENMRLALKGDLDLVETNVRSQFEMLRTEMARMEGRLLTWFIGALIAVGALTAAILKL